MMEFSATIRQKHIDALESKIFDLIIIGGGITGAGVARDAAMRGLSVLLIEEKDFAFGTSSRSSKLIHGGIRYLENFDFALVFEALSERTKLFEMAPHLVHPLRFILPIYRGDRVGMNKMSLGMWAYDALALFNAPAFHERLTVKETLRRVPTLSDKELLGSFEYSDAYMDDDRLVIETLRSAHREGAWALNYFKAMEPIFNGSKVEGLVCEDTLKKKFYKIKGHHVVSTVGPWTDRVAAHWLAGWKPILRPTKGIHIVLEKGRIPIEAAVVMSTRSDKRIVFAIPRHEMLIVGTTDTDYEGDPGNVHALNEEIEYLLNITNKYFGLSKISKSDILGTYAGVRPLIADRSETAGKTSREHLILSDPRNITFVAGGKYTTFRHMAQQIVKVAMKSLPPREQKVISTAAALNPKANLENYRRAQRYCCRWSQMWGYDFSEVAKLVFRHGMEAEDILSSSEELSVTTGKKPTVLQMEVFHAIKQTMCLTLSDFLQRRTPLFLTERDQGKSRIDEILSASGHHFLNI